jgi:hypothetical protein
MLRQCLKVGHGHFGSRASSSSFVSILSFDAMWLCSWEGVIERKLTCLKRALSCTMSWEKADSIWFQGVWSVDILLSWTPEQSAGLSPSTAVLQLTLIVLLSYNSCNSTLSFLISNCILLIYSFIYNQFYTGIVVHSVVLQYQNSLLFLISPIFVNNKSFYTQKLFPPFSHSRTFQ